MSASNFGSCVVPDQRRRVDDVRRVALGVAVLLRVRVEHQLRERAMQAGEIATQEREPRPGQLGRRREIDHAERFAKIGVILGLEIERARRATAAHFDVVVGGPAFRRRWMSDVRQFEQEIAQLRLHALELALEVLQLVACAGHLAQAAARHPARRLWPCQPACSARCASPAAAACASGSSCAPASSDSKRPVSSTTPRLASAAATPARSLRIALMSIIEEF
jgi:hypothetical protein